MHTYLLLIRQFLPLLDLYGQSPMIYIYFFTILFIQTHTDTQNNIFPASMKLLLLLSLCHGVPQYKVQSTLCQTLCYLKITYCLQGHQINVAFAMMFNVNCDCQCMCLYTRSFLTCRQGWSHPDRKEVTLPPQWENNLFIVGLSTWPDTSSFTMATTRFFYLAESKGLSSLKPVNNALGVVLKFELLIKC